MNWRPFPPVVDRPVICNSANVDRSPIFIINVHASSRYLIILSSWLLLIIIINIKFSYRVKLLYTQDAQNQYHCHTCTLIVHGKMWPHPRPPYSRYRSTTKGGRLLMTYAIYACCTVTRDRDAKQSSCKIGDNQAIKTSFVLLKSRSRWPFTPPTPHPPLVGNQESRLFYRCDQALKVQKCPRSNFDPSRGCHWVQQVYNYVITPCSG